MSGGDSTPVALQSPGARFPTRRTERGKFHVTRTVVSFLFFFFFFRGAIVTLASASGTRRRLSQTVHRGSSRGESRARSLPLLNYCHRAVTSAPCGIKNASSERVPTHTYVRGIRRLTRLEIDTRDILRDYLEKNDS